MSEVELPPALGTWGVQSARGGQLRLDRRRAFIEASPLVGDVRTTPYDEVPGLWTDATLSYGPGACPRLHVHAAPSIQGHAHESLSMSYLGFTLPGFPSPERMREEIPTRAWCVAAPLLLNSPALSSDNR